MTFSQRKISGTVKITIEGWFFCELISHAGFVGNGWRYLIFQSAMHVRISSQIYLKGM